MPNRPSGPRTSQTADPYYGREETSKLCARFIKHLFECPELPPLSTADPPTPSPPLAKFVAYALHRTRLEPSATFAALYLLQRLKARYPAARGSSGHRLIISAFMIASKFICDDTYSNRAWSIAGQGMFPLREINMMERELCSYLEWQLNIEPNALKEFEQRVRRDFKGVGPYPTYVVPFSAPSPMPSTTPYNNQTGVTATTPSFTASSQQPPSTSLNPIPAPVPLCAGPPPSSATSHWRPRTPDTPEFSWSNSTSPATSASPSTPAGYADLSVRLVGSGTLSTSRMPASTTTAHISTRTGISSSYVRQQPPAVRTDPRTDFLVRIKPCVW